jgi:hypothetical protein
VLADSRYLDARSDSLKRVDPKCKVPELVPAGVHIRDPMSEKWVRKQRATLKVTQVEYDDWEANLRAKITDGYGRWDIVNILLGRPGHVAGAWICSALVVNAIQHMSRAWASGWMQRAGRVPYPLPAPAHEISPDMALMILATAGFTLGPVISAPAPTPPAG